jgi:hypothetical protein
MKRAAKRVAQKADALRGELRLAWFEWRGLLSQSLAFEFEKRIESSPLYEPGVHLARLKLSRILVRMAGSVLHKNLAAFEAALKDLIELGKSV